MVNEKAIIRRNSWWLTGKVPEKLLGIRREVYTERILDSFGNRKILAVLGIRRSGKNTLLYQTIHSLLEERKPETIFYLSAEDLEDKDRSGIEAALDLFEQRNGIDLEKDSACVFIDEIQQVSDWQNVMKRFYDLKYKSKFIVSGSSASLIYKDASESLVGRIEFLNVFPLSFREFLGFKGISVPECGLEMKSLKAASRRLSDKENRIKGMLAEYVEVGGFPEWFEVGDRHKWFKVLSDEYVSLLLYRDIVKVFRIRDPLLLESLFRFIARHSSERFSYLGIAKRNDSDKETSKQYLFHLSKSGMIHISDFFTKSRKVSERKEKKVRVCDSGLKNALVGTYDQGLLIEDVVFLHSLREISKDVFGKVFYWTDKAKREVDIVVDTGREALPIEVKYSDSVSESDIKGLKSFCDKFSTEKAVVVTKSELAEKEICGARVLFVPTWLFLLADMEPIGRDK